MGEKFEAFKGFLFENILGIATEYGGNLLKEQGTELITNQALQIGANVAIDAGVSMVPAIGNAISSFRTNKQIANLQILIDELFKRSDEMSRAFSEQTEENKKVLDQIFDTFFQSAINSDQEDKIKFMVSGYSKLLKVANPSFDVAYLYFNVLDSITILDIEVLKLMYPLWAMENPEEFKAPDSYEDVLDKFNIDIPQYNAVKNHLMRVGLVEDQYDSASQKDMKKVEEAIQDIVKSLKSIENAIDGKSKRINKLTNKSNFKLKAKTKLKISKFGRDFVDFFLMNQQETL